jgi:hypothetical protein
VELFNIRTTLVHKTHQVEPLTWVASVAININTCQARACLQILYLKKKQISPNDVQARRTRRGPMEAQQLQKACSGTWNCGTTGRLSKDEEF